MGETQWRSDKNTSYTVNMPSASSLWYSDPDNGQDTLAWWNGVAAWLLPPQPKYTASVLRKCIHLQSWSFTWEEDVICSRPEEVEDTPILVTLQ